MVFNSTLTFILIVLLSSADFWAVQNVTGRLLVGLRWRNELKQDGTEEWIFESFDEDPQSNKFDLYVFWGSLVGFPAVWVIFLFANILTFNLFWVRYI